MLNTITLTVVYNKSKMYFSTIPVKSALMLHNYTNYLCPMCKMWAKCILAPFQLKAHLCYTIILIICVQCVQSEQNVF